MLLVRNPPTIDFPSPTEAARTAGPPMLLIECSRSLSAMQNDQDQAQSRKRAWPAMIIFDSL